MAVGLHSRLGLDTLAGLPAVVARPAFAPAALPIGIVHLGLGAFHRAHQALYTDDAIAAAGGDWGILGVSLHNPQVPDALSRQDGLFTVETLQEPRAYRVVGALREAVAAPQAPQRVLDAIAAPTTHIVTLTVTEKGYGRGAGGELDTGDPAIAADLQGGGLPRSTLGWLAAGLRARRAAGGGGLSVISCDNLMANGDTLRRLLAAFVEASDRDLAAWIADRVSFPNSMVDSITPASDDALRARIATAIGVADLAGVQREPFAQWVVEDAFAGPRPAWDAAGVEFTGDVPRFQKLKLHVLNTANSALAYLGLARGHVFAHEAYADPQIAAFVEGLIGEEMAAAFPDLPIVDYWRTVRPRLANPHVRHALRQIGEDGSAKLAQRVFEPLRQNLRAGRPHARLAVLVRTWIAVAQAGTVRDPLSEALQARPGLAAVLVSPLILPEAFRADPLVRRALEAAAPFGGPFPPDPQSSQKGVTP